MDLVELIKQIERSVVRIETDHGLGSGVIVDDQGYVITNYHVIEGAKRAKIVLRTGKPRQAAGFLVVDPRRDLALLKTDAFRDPHAVKLAADLPQPGEKVAAFGNPIGFAFSTSEGIVSAVRPGRDVAKAVGADFYRSLGYDLEATWIQSIAPISHGNSGGPLVTMQGDLVGLNTWSMPEGQNLNFAVSIVDIKRIIGKADSAPIQQFTSLPGSRRRSRAIPSGVLTGAEPGMVDSSSSTA